MKTLKQGRTSRIVTAASIVLAAGFPLGAPTSDEAVQLVFLPEEGSTLTYVLESNSTLELVESSVVESMDGEERSMEPPETRELEQTERYTFVDEIVAVDKDRVTTLIRSFEEVHSEHDNVGTSGEEDWSDAHAGTSELHEAQIRFTWDDEAERYGCEPADEELESDFDEELLDGLELDVYLIGMLPEGEVSVGDTWEAEATNYFRIMYPGGVLRIVSHEGDDPALDNGYEIRDAMEGDVSVTLLKVEDSEDGRVAVLGIEIDIECGTQSESDIEWEGVGTGTNTVTLTILTEVSGEARWSLDHNLPISLTLAGTQRYENESAASISGEHDYESSYTTALDGEIEFELSWE